MSGNSATFVGDMTPRSLDKLKHLTADEKRALLKKLLTKKAQSAAGEFSLSAGQRALWFLHKLLPDSHSYNVAITALLRPALNVAALERALAHLVEQHAALRTIFIDQSGQPRQRILAPGPVTIRQVNVAADDAALRREVIADYRRPFNIEQSLFRASIFHAADGSDVLLIAVHHLIFDASSALILFEDLRVLYDAELRNSGAKLPTCQARYADYVAWQEQLMATPQAEKLWEYWQSVMAGSLPVLQFGPKSGTAVGGPEAADTRDDSGAVPLTFSPELAIGIRSLARQCQTTVYTVMLAALQCVLHLHCRANDILIGSPVSGRSRPEWSRVIGYFINMLPLRVSVASETRFHDHLASTRQVVFAALEHQDFPFPAMVERLRIARDRNGAPVIQVMFNLVSSGRGNQAARLFADETEGGDVKLGDSVFTSFQIPQQEGQFEFVVEIADVDGHLAGNLKYGASVGSGNAREIARAYSTVLDMVVRNPEFRIAELLPAHSQREDILL